MDSNKKNKLIKSPLYSVKILKDELSLVKRGLRDLGILPKSNILLEKIEEQYESHNYKKCIDLCDEVLTSEPFMFLPLCYKAFSLERLFKYDEALVWCEKALKTESFFEHPQSAQNYEKYNYISAESDFEALTGNKGFCLYKLGRFEEAITCLDKAIELTPQHFINLYNKGKCLNELGKGAEAELFFVQAVVFSFERNSMAEKLSTIAITNANIVLDEILNDRNQYEWGVKIWQARIFCQQKKYHEAIQLFSEYLHFDEKSGDVWEFKGDCYWNLGDYKNALNDYLRAIVLNPSQVSLLDDSAMCFAKLGDYNKAHQYIDQAIAMVHGVESPEDWPEMPMIRKAQFFESQGKKEEAHDQYKMVIEQYPPNKYTNSDFANKKILELSKYSDIYSANEAFLYHEKITEDGYKVVKAIGVTNQSDGVRATHEYLKRLGIMGLDFEVIFNLYPPSYEEAEITYKDGRKESIYFDVSDFYGKE